MRVVILHAAVSAGDSVADRDVLVQAEAITGALERLGHEPLCRPCSLNLESLRAELLALRPDVVFNLVEGLGGSDWLAYLATSLLDLMRLPYTGSPTVASGTTVYNLTTQGCCGTTAYTLATQGCCGDLSYYLDTEGCCYGTVYELAAEQCCDLCGCVIAIEEEGDEE